MQREVGRDAPEAILVVAQPYACLGTTRRVNASHGCLVLLLA